MSTNLYGKKAELLDKLLTQIDYCKNIMFELRIHERKFPCGDMDELNHLHDILDSFDNGVETLTDAVLPLARAEESRQENLQ